MNCKRKQINHPLDPIEFDCDCDSAKNGEACDFIVSIITSSFSKKIRKQLDEDLINMGISIVKIKENKKIQYIDPLSKEALKIIQNEKNKRNVS